MDFAQLKVLVVGTFLLKSDVPTMLTLLALIQATEYAFFHAPAVFAFVKKWLNQQKPHTDLGEAEHSSSITMTRVFGAKTATDNVYVEKADAVLDYICSLDDARHLRMDTRCVLNNSNTIQLTPQLNARVQTSFSSEEDGRTEIVLYSNTLTVREIREWIDEVHAAYASEKNNKLGNKIYYFNEMPAEVQTVSDMSEKGTVKKAYRWETMPKQLTFTMNEFKTSKSFSNVYGDHVNELKERLDLFVNHPEWYAARGIPHSLGVLLHGIPGAGKTSTIKAIARDTHRHIFNLSLRPYTTQRQLTNLFFNETVVVQTYDGGKQTLKIPVNKRVYVIEDIDCLTDVVIDRQIRGTAEDSKEGEAVTLAFLLNLLDGVLETPGRILVITSNYPDKLDKALIRPGRVDVKLEFKNATRVFIQDMINKFYCTDVNLESIPHELDSVFTPAEVMESMCMHFKNASDALAHMVGKIAAKQAETAGTSLARLGIFEHVNEDSESEYDAGTDEDDHETNDSASSSVGNEERAEGFTTWADLQKQIADQRNRELFTCPACNKELDDYFAYVQHMEAQCVPEDELPEKKDIDYGDWVCTTECKEARRMLPNCKDCLQKIKDLTEKSVYDGARDTTEEPWERAMFTDMTPPEGAGGYMPGEFGVRSDVDLNAI